MLMLFFGKFLNMGQTRFLFSRLWFLGASIRCHKASRELGSLGKVIPGKYLYSIANCEISDSWLYFLANCEKSDSCLYFLTNCETSYSCLYCLANSKTSSSCLISFFSLGMVIPGIYLYSIANCETSDSCLYFLANCETSNSCLHCLANSKTSSSYLIWMQQLYEHCLVAI